MNTDREDRGDRIAATIRHNRARGKHRIDGMAEIVLELKRRNWSDKKIGKNLGMDPDEVLRLSQITGLAEMFADKEFSEAWEADTTLINEDDRLEVSEEETS
jgi:ParB-like chromosome segregation protein Spo0J